MKKEIICLGIESTAHTFGIGIISSKKIYANEKIQFKGVNGGGIKPIDASIFHYQNAHSVLLQALSKSNLSLKDIDCISFAKGPGLPPCLSVGATLARALSLRFNKPLFGVNHCVAHIEIGKTLTGAKDPLVIYTSGANTQIIAKDDNVYKVLGETLDIGIGNLFDSFARDLGFGFPGGPILDKMYVNSSKTYISLPYSVKGMDLTFSGLLTFSKKLIGREKTEDLVYSFMHTAYAMLLEVAERGLSYTGKKELMVIGGVAASHALKEMLVELASLRKIKLYIPPFDACLDNGLMIADLGLKYYLSGEKQTIDESGIDGSFRTDYVRLPFSKPFYFLKDLRNHK